MCKTCENCENLKERIIELEKIITPNSLTLVNKQDLNEKVVISYDGEVREQKITTTHVTETLNETTGL